MKSFLFHSNASAESSASLPERPPAGSAGSANPGAIPATHELAKFAGIDLGAETIKVAELWRARDGRAFVGRKLIAEHGKNPAAVLRDLLEQIGWATVEAAAVTGRLSVRSSLPRIPIKQAQRLAYRFLLGEQPGTVVSIGSRGFSVLELRGGGPEIFRENGRCSQGTGNFLRQLVERFSLTVEEASRLCASVDQAAPLSGRCPVILKTDMTHLANQGEDRGRILAGLFDAVCDNILTLIKPGLSPERVVLIGGVSRSLRVQNSMREALGRQGMTLCAVSEEHARHFEAIGAALAAAEQPAAKPALDELWQHSAKNRLEKTPALSQSLGQVQRLTASLAVLSGPAPAELILGFDIGSTGSKLIAMDAVNRQPIWEAYRRTDGNPVAAAQDLLRQFVDNFCHAFPGRCDVLAFGVTGSGREIVGSLLTTCFGEEAVFVLNEIAAHAEGALHYDRRVDTIFEIGGQDAKYIRLQAGKVIDCAMNEACSAGTGSFIEEQGRKFSGVQNVGQLAQEALAASEGISLGQHCSVFMAEVIDDAVAAGADSRSIIAGLYDSIVQNYLHRVKGNRSVGQVVFCQGMPFSADALAAAVARQTGSQVIVPPNPGTVGALGIALLAERELPWKSRPPAEPRKFLEARIDKKETFICHAQVGCGGAGNKCRINRIKTVVSQERRQFAWGGACSLYDKGTRQKKLTAKAPNPMQEREQLAQELARPFLERRGRRTIAVSSEFMLKGLFPFFAGFLSELGFDLLLAETADQSVLKTGIRQANVPFCAPMQLFHGVGSKLAELNSDFIFIPMLRSLPRCGDEPHSGACPIVQGSPEILRWDLAERFAGRLISPVIDLSGGLDSAPFLESCRSLAVDLGAPDLAWKGAHESGCTAQRKFAAGAQKIGERALAFCRNEAITPVVVVGRPYTIYNKVLNSNVPSLLREQGVMAIPMDCFPVADSAPVFPAVYWAYGQQILRAAQLIRQTPGLYSVYCSNYSCGPDSFNLHFFSSIMQGKPFAIIETDGHSGDAGTKTRIEAFLFCVRQHVESADDARGRFDLQTFQRSEIRLEDLLRSRERLLIPFLGVGSGVVAACLRGRGAEVEVLAPPGRESLQIGRRFTSGKECIPLCLTLGSLLERLQHEKQTADKFALVMPSSCGPCRFGIYHLLQKVILAQLGWGERVRVWAPADSNYFSELPAGFTILLLAGFVAADYLLAALHDSRPDENAAGLAEEIYQRRIAELLELLQRHAAGPLHIASSLGQVASGKLFGVGRLLREAAAEFAQGRARSSKPTILVVGEIYVRLVPFANDGLIEKLEARGFRAKLAPFNEWLEYVDECNRKHGPGGISQRLIQAVRSRIQNRLYSAMAGPLRWPNRVSAAEMLKTARPYLRDELEGEAVLTIGNPLHEWRARDIDAAISIGPLECMPNKIAEAQFFHIAAKEGLPVLTLPVNGDPIDATVLDNFAYEVLQKRQLAVRP